MGVTTRSLNENEADRFLTVIGECPDGEAMYAAMVALTLGLGGRISEILKLKTGDVLNDGHKVRDEIRRHIAKKRRSVTMSVPFLNPDLIRIVQRYADQLRNPSTFDPENYFFSRRYNNQPVRYLTAYKHVREFYRAAGITPGLEHVAFHGLRKTFAGRLYQEVRTAIGDLQALEYMRSMLGHKNISTTMIYLNVKPLTSDQERMLYMRAMAKIGNRNPHI